MPCFTQTRIPSLVPRPYTLMVRPLGACYADAICRLVMLFFFDGVLGTELVETPIIPHIPHIPQ